MQLLGARVGALDPTHMPCARGREAAQRRGSKLPSRTEKGIANRNRWPTTHWLNVETVKFPVPFVSYSSAEFRDLRLRRGATAIRINLSGCRARGLSATEKEMVRKHQSAVDAVVVRALGRHVASIQWILRAAKKFVNKSRP